jgi:hypothetical protein
MCRICQELAVILDDPGADEEDTGELDFDYTYEFDAAADKLFRVLMTSDRSMRSS